MIKQLLLAGLLFFVASSFGIGKCFVCKDKVPDIRDTEKITLCCDHSCHIVCLNDFENDVLINCPECGTEISADKIQEFQDAGDAPEGDPVRRANRRPRSPLVNSVSNIRNRVLFMLGGCGVAAAVLYYFRDVIGDLVWGKKETQSEADSQAVI